MTADSLFHRNLVRCAQHWFKPFPFIIVGINILIACVSDFESAVMGWNKWWLTSEGVWQYGGWHNVMNGVAGLFAFIRQDIVP